MQTPHQILAQYWGFKEFRPKQEAIIQAVVDRQDTLALLPTGGGKSICYQVPGLLMEGVCLVISPLIALMNDQVQQLNAKGIKAIAITSAMSKREIDIALDNVIYGSIKFIYVSPERLKTHIFKVRFEKMNVNLIAVDEAHCISEWGYDFRPAYLEIAQLRKLKPAVPFLALTATATPDVVEDIQNKLEFKKQHVISKSFERKNITYNTQLTNNKLNRIETYIKAKQGSGIIYCSTRRAVKELCLSLLEKGHSVDYYHGGLDFEERQKKQSDWTQNTTRIIIATNAFGMGIDKPDVRFVLHYDIPASIEAYYQEAGRGGRDEKEAEAYLFYEAKDIHDLEKKTTLKFPEIELIKRIYNALGNHFQLAIGSGKGERYPLNLSAFAEKYNQNLVTVYNALKFLEVCDFIQLSENFKQPGRLKVLVNNTTLYSHQVSDTILNKIMQFILRTEMGVFDDYVRIDEYKIAKKTGLSVEKVKHKLTHAHQLELIDYIPKNDLPSITYITERLADDNLSISPQFYHNRKKIVFSKLEAIIDFVRTESCKSVFLLNYFGEKDAPVCGKCISCIHTPEIQPKNIRSAIKKVSQQLKQENNHVLIIDLIAQLNDYPEKEILTTLRQMAEYDEIIPDSLGKTFEVRF